MSKHIQLIHDENEVKWFFDHVMPPLTDTECYFLSLSARNKYLSPEEREELELGRTEMFEKRIIRERSWEKFIRTLRKLECDERGYTTKNNSPIPSKSLVCYLNINPSNTVKAIAEFQKLLNEYFIEASSIAFEKSDNTNLAKRFNKLDNNLMTYYQQATGTRHWIDFDLALPKDTETLYSLDHMLQLQGLSHYYWISTKSGYHLLLPKSQLTFNPQVLVDSMCWVIEEEQQLCKKGEYEVIYNKNAMIPLPGTYQGGHKVTVINKEHV